MDSSNSQNEQEIKKQNNNKMAIIIFWQLKGLITKTKTSIQSLFQIYDKDKDNILNLYEFTDLIQLAKNPTITQENIAFLFDQLKTNQYIGINVKSLEDAFNAIDLVNDDPNRKKESTHGKVANPKKESTYGKVMLKIALLKDYHKNQQLNVLLLRKLGQFLSLPKFIQFFDICRIKFTQEEQQELHKVLVETTIIKSDSTQQNQQYVNIDQFINWIGIHIPQQQIIPQVQSNQPQKPSSQQKIINQNNNNSINNNNINNNNNQMMSNYNYPSQQLQNNQDPLDIVQIFSNKHSHYKQTEFYTFDTEDDIINADKFIQMFDLYLQQKKYFEDNDFLPRTETLYSKPSQKNGEWNSLVWLRPEDIFQGSYEMFSKIDDNILTSRIGLGKFITPYDIQQGALGDCYFLSALSSIAYDPQRILNLFITRKINPIGLYCVKICINGEYKAFWIDDRIPCYPQNNQPAFTKAGDQKKEIWVLLLEKVWAKIFGSYEQIESGLCREALRNLTGAPTQSIFIEEDNKLNENLLPTLYLSFEKRNKYILACGTNDDEEGLTKSKADRLGLVQGHAYSIINIFKVIHPKNQQEINLIKLRNPWGKKEWKGDWSDNSPLWTEQLKTQCHFKNHNDGIFYMDFTDFQRYFSDVSICYYYDFYQYSSHRFTYVNKKSIFIKIQIQKSGKYYFTINQISKRQFPKNSGYDYSQARLLIMKQENTDFFYISGKRKKDIETYVGQYLLEGTYIIMAKLEQNNFNNNQFVLSSYGPGKLNLANKIDKLTDTQFQKVFINKALRSQPNFKPYSFDPNIKKHIEFSIDDGFGYIYLQNKSQKLLETTIKLKNSHNIKPKKPNQGFQYKVLLPPQEDYIIIFTITGKGGYGYEMEESYILNK